MKSYPQLRENSFGTERVLSSAKILFCIIIILVSCEKRTAIQWIGSHALCLYWTPFAEENFEPQAFLISVHSKDSIRTDLSFYFYDSFLTRDTFALERISQKKQHNIHELKLGFAATDLQELLADRGLEKTCQEKILVDMLNNAQLIAGRSVVDKASDHSLKVGPQN